MIHFGYAGPREYGALLRRADVVVSTAIHEFFGVSIVEAVYCGCFPVLPRRLSYPEIIPRSHHEACLYDDFEGMVAKLGWALSNPHHACEAAAALLPDVARFDWSKLGPRYDAALEALIAGR